MTLHQLQKIGNSLDCPVAIIVKNGKILHGLRNYTEDKWKKISVWTLPGGRCDEGETLEQTLRREVEEETGITELKIMDYIGETPGAKEGDNAFIFFATTKQEAILMEPEKFSEWRWVSIDEYLQGGLYSLMNPAAHVMISNYLKK